MSERPGTMIYFDDLLPLFDVLKEGEVGQLLRAIVFYGKYGEAPDFSDAAALEIAWGFIKTKIDRDADKYEKEIGKRKYAAYCREAKKHGEEPKPFDEWCHVIPTDVTWYPTGTATATVKGTVTEKETVTPAETGAGAGKGEGKGIPGEGEGKPPPFDMESYERERLKRRPY